MTMNEGEEEVPTPVLIQVLGNIPGLRYFSNFYKFIIHTADPRADRYPFMKNPDTTAAIVLAYLLFCLIFGPKYMRNRQTPIFAQGMLCFYNLITIYINAFLALTLTHYVFSTKQNLLCEKVDDSEGNDTTWIMTLLYIFHLSKIVELVDTIFLVWKKKNSQLSFLHVYHHSTIVAATWIGVKFAPGGSTAVICMINSWVHVFMYTYYQLTAIRVALSKKLKKFLTLVQMGQFCYTLAVCTNGLWIAPCNYPEWILWWLFLYMLSFLTLFSNFFYETYAKQKTEGNKICHHHLKHHSQSCTANHFNFKEELLQEPTQLQSTLFEMNNIRGKTPINLIGHVGSNGFAPKSSHQDIINRRLVNGRRSFPPVYRSDQIRFGPNEDDDSSDEPTPTEEFILNERIQLKRVERSQQINAEFKLVNNSLEVCQTFGERLPPAINQQGKATTKEPNKVKKFRKKKNQKKK